MTQCMKHGDFKSTPAPPSGLERIRAILRQKHARELRRIEPDALHECMTAEEQLKSTVPAERQKAATTLGDLRYIDSFEPLLYALARESEPDRGDRAVKAAIL